MYNVQENICSESEHLKEYLPQHRNLKDRISFKEGLIYDLSREISELEQLWDGEIKDPCARIRMNCLQQERKAAEADRDADLELLARLEAQMKRMFAKLPKQTMRLVMEGLYLYDRTYRKTAELIPLDLSNVVRCRQKALKLLRLPEDAVDITKEGSCKL